MVGSERGSEHGEEVEGDGKRRGRRARKFYKRVRLVGSVRGRGGGEALNMGCNLPEFQYIFFFWPDDSEGKVGGWQPTGGRKKKGLRSGLV